MRGARHVKYEVDRVFHYLGARFVREVGLVPTVGVVARDKVGPATLDLLRRWRERVALFQEWGLAPPCPVREGGPSKLSAMYNCPPAFAVCKPAKPAAVVACGVKALCPSCAARAALPVWERVDRLLFGAHAVSIATAAAPGKVLPRALSFDDDPGDDDPRRLDGVTLLTRLITYTLPFDGRQTLAGFVANRASRACVSGDRARRKSEWVPNRQNEAARLKAAGVMGGVDAMHVGLKYDRAGGKATPSAWVVGCRQLVALPTARFDDIILAPALAGTPTTKAAHSAAVLERVHSPTRQDLLRGVAMALRHSRVPMTAGRDHVTEYLAARAGHRTFATFGSWHGAAAARS